MLSLRMQRLADTTIVHCVGRMILPEVDRLRSVFQHVPTRTLVLDLADVAVVDASGLGALLFLRAQAVEKGTTLKLMNLSPKIERLLQLTRLKPAFELCSAREVLELLCRAIHKAGLVPLEPVLQDQDRPASILSTTPLGG
jgi:anti-anti-sigma factor